MKAEAATVEEYLKELPDDRRKPIETVRAVILKALPEGYEEVMNWGMITYEVPLSICPDTYNKKPLMYAALASQKHRMTVYLNGIYVDSERRRRFEEAYERSGKKLNAGKSCVHFRKLEDLPLDVIEESIASIPVEEFVEMNKKARAGRK